MILICDTNVWIKENGLKSKLGTVLRHWIKNNNIKLGLPGIIKIEVENNLKQIVSDNLNKINDNYEKMLQLLGEAKEIVLPDQKIIDDFINSIFKNLNVEVVEREENFEDYKSALEMVLKKVPPNGEKNQQFKDSLLWQTILVWSKIDEIGFITDDKGFYQNRRYNDGLDESLKLDLGNCADRVKIFNDIKNVIDEIKSEIIIDENLLLNEILAIHREKMAMFLGFYQLDTSNFSFKLKKYYTEDTDRILVSFVLNINAQSKYKNKSDFQYQISGEIYYNNHYKSFHDLRLGEETLFEIRENERKILKRNINIFVGGINVGHNTKKYVLQEEIKD